MARARVQPCADIARGASTFAPRLIDTLYKKWRIGRSQTSLFLECLFIGSATLRRHPSINLLSIHQLCNFSRHRSTNSSFISAATLVVIRLTPLRLSALKFLIRRQCQHGSGEFHLRTVQLC